MDLAGRDLDASQTTISIVPRKSAEEPPLVLVIEDEPTQRNLLTRVLEREGYRVIGLGDGETGMRAIVEHSPQLVLLDLNLPRMDGYEICRQLRADPLTATLPVMVITAHTAPGDMVAALDAGADDFLAKPVQQYELLARIRSAMRLRRAITSLERATQIVAALANAVEAKDLNLVNHCRWLAHHAARVGAQVGLRGEELEAVAYGALLHDVGKIGVSEHLLRKEGPLSDEEWLLMRRHPEIGEKICAPLRASRAFAPIIRHHPRAFRRHRLSPAPGGRADPAGRPHCRDRRRIRGDGPRPALPAVAAARSRRRRAARPARHAVRSRARAGVSRRAGA